MVMSISVALVWSQSAWSTTVIGRDVSLVGGMVVWGGGEAYATSDPKAPTTQQTSPCTSRRRRECLGIPEQAEEPIIDSLEDADHAYGWRGACWVLALLGSGLW